MGAWNAGYLRLKAIITSMYFFTGDRERRLWLWVLAVVVAIYSTLGPAQTLVGALRERNLLRVSFALGLFLVGRPSPGNG
jgi:hypothetical protein